MALNLWPHLCSQAMQDLTGKLLRLEFKTKTFGSDGKEALKNSRIGISRRQCWSPPHELGGFFLASKSFFISSSFLARFGIFKKKKGYCNFAST